MRSRPTHGGEMEANRCTQLVLGHPVHNKCFSAMVAIELNLFFHPAFFLREQGPKACERLHIVFGLCSVRIGTRSCHYCVGRQRTVDQNLSCHWSGVRPNAGYTIVSYAFGNTALSLCLMCLDNQNARGRGR